MVWLSPELFELRGQDLALLGLFERGLHGEHRIQAERGHASVEAWLARQSEAIREVCELVLDSGTQEESLRPSSVTVVVVGGTSSDWASASPRISMTDARRLLERKFEIYVEDGTSDRAFLRKMMTEAELELIDELEQTERLRFVHGGGSRLELLLRQRAQDPRARLQTWVLIDSDALAPGKPSRASSEICELCRTADIPCHRLSRRFIESYLPPDALERWGKAIPKLRDENLKLVRAFKRLSTMQRHLYNMKDGFDQDRPRQAEVGGLYDDVPERDRQRLDRGFGKKIGELFQDRYPGSQESEGATCFVFERELRNDGGWDELRPAVRELFARLGVA